MARSFRDDPFLVYQDWHSPAGNYEGAHGGVTEVHTLDIPGCL